ncbi:TcpE family conjugal transfer membrane protein [Thermoanaerobacterium thermosaccharolyticum]|uniref:TcpE family conjugal transfer membrane protein n=1 Tax=Thermoanaerobacterium thermosaccharolyticum TaxID=1517 RepID=UPI003DA956F0
MQTYKSYRSLFRINFAIHEVMGKQLPRPITLDALASFAMFFIINSFIFHIIPVSNPVLWNSITSMLLGYIFSQFDPQGKFMIVWLIDFFFFLIRYKTINLQGKKLTQKRKMSIDDWYSIKI